MLALRDAEDAGGKQERLASHVSRGQCHRRSSHHGRPARERADPVLDAARVARDHAHVVGGEAELVGRHLGEGGLETLALGSRAGEHRDASPRIHPHARSLERAHAHQLDVACEPHAHEAALGAGGRRIRAKRIVACALERPTEHGGEIAAVENDVAARTVVGEPDVPRHVLGSHEIGQPHLCPLAPRLARHQIEDTLDHEHRLRLPGAAVRRHRHPVRVAALEAREHGRDPVGPGEHGRGEERNHEAARRIGARIVHEPVAESEDPPRGVEAHRHAQAAHRPGLERHAGRLLQVFPKR